MVVGGGAAFERISKAAPPLCRIGRRLPEREDAQGVERGMMEKDGVLCGKKGWKS